jgi:hypothetical protein
MRSPRLIIFLAQIVFLLSLAFAQTDLRQELEQRYQTFLTICKNGELDALPTVWSDYRYCVTVNNLKSANRELDNTVLQSIAEYSPNPGTESFLKLYSNGPTAGLLYRQYISEYDQERVEFTFIKFVWEKGIWKVDGVQSIGDARYRDDGSESMFDIAGLESEMAIDGIVKAAPERLLGSVMAATMNIFSYGYKTTVLINNVMQDETTDKFSTGIIKGGLGAGDNTIVIFFSKSDPDTPHKPSVTLLRKISEEENEKVFEFAPQTAIEGRHEFTFRVE